MGISREELHGKLDDAKRSNAAISSAQDITLHDIRSRIEDAKQEIGVGNSILGKISDAMRMDWLRQLGHELKGLMHRAFAINVATYHAVISIQKVLPSRLERGLIEEPFILEDPIGRVAPVHLQFVTSWDAFNAILEIRFRALQGQAKIKNKKYCLQDKVTTVAERLSARAAN